VHGSGIPPGLSSCTEDAVMLTVAERTHWKERIAKGTNRVLHR